jgi:hypothetical protein
MDRLHTRFTISLDLGNDAMQTPYNVADALNDLGDRLRTYPGLDNGYIRDENGNTIGSFQFHTADEDND